MLTYEDCLGLSELTPEAIGAIARHEHLPEIVALEMGSFLYRTTEGKRMLRGMILADIEEAYRGRDMAAAARLERVLRCFGQASSDQPSSDTAENAVAADEALPLSSRGLEQRIRALGFDAATAPWVRQRVEAYFIAMLRHFGLDRAQLQDRFQLELLAAETSCAACARTEQCRRFLAGVAESEAPAAFCPNAQLFDRLRQDNHAAAEPCSL